MSRTARKTTEVVNNEVVTEAVIETAPTEAVTEVEAVVEAEVVQPKIEDVDLTACGSNKSAKMRTLAALGFSTSAIAKFLDVKYQFVRNVLNQKKAPSTTAATES